MTTTIIVGGTERRIGDLDSGSGGATFYVGDGAAAVRTDRALFRFQTINSEIPNTPPVKVSAVNLYFRLYYAYAGNATIPSWTNYLNRVTKSWTITANWTSYAGVTLWETDGCSGSTDRSSTVSGSFSVTKDQTEVDVNITGGATMLADVEGWINGTLSNEGYLMTAPTLEGLGVQRDTEIYSSAYGVTAQRPTLTVTWAIPRPGSHFKHVW